MEVLKCWIMLEFQNISIKMKNCKSFYEVQTASCLKEIIQPLPNLQPIPHQIKSYYVFRKKIYGDIQKYTDIWFQSASKMQFFGVKKWRIPNVFSDTKQKHVYWKFCKVRKVFDCVAGASYFQYQVSWGS